MLIPTIDRLISVTLSGTSPAERVEPISLAWAKQHLRFPTTAEDALLIGYLAAARTYFEEQSGRQCIDAIWEYTLDGAPGGGVIELPRPPLAEIVSVTYDDGTGVAQTLDPASYRVLPSFVTPDDDSDPVIDPYCPPGRIELVSGGAWPTIGARGQSLRIRRRCGYGATSEAMPPLLLATLGLLAQYFHGRQTDKLPAGADILISAFKWTALPVLSPATWPVGYFPFQINSIP